MALKKKKRDEKVVLFECVSLTRLCLPLLSSHNGELCLQKYISVWRFEIIAGKMQIHLMQIIEKKGQCIHAWLHTGHFVHITV